MCSIATSYQKCTFLKLHVTSTSCSYSLHILYLHHLLQHMVLLQSSFHIGSLFAWSVIAVESRSRSLRASHFTRETHVLVPFCDSPWNENLSHCHSVIVTFYFADKMPMYCGLFFVALVAVLLTGLSVAAVTGVRGISSRIALFGVWMLHLSRLRENSRRARLA